jgi:hypothetical protein
MDQSYIEKLILDGSLEVSGITESGDLTYSFKEGLEQKHPEIYKQLSKLLYDHITMFWQHGFLEFDMTEIDPVISLTEKIYDNEALSKLSEIERINLNIVINTLSDRQQ